VAETTDALVEIEGGIIDIEPIPVQPRQPEILPEDLEKESVNQLE
jgi:hypothetical protein